MAAAASPTSTVIESPAARAASERGLALVFGCEEKIAMRRGRDGLWIANEEYPQIALQDFEILERKEREDPKLVQHLIQVTALAESFLGGHVVLSDLGRNVLKIACLYHDFGGYLNQVGVQKEQETIERFKKVSRLDRRLLDSRIVYELLKLNGHSSAAIDESLPELLDDSVNSAVQLLKVRQFDDDDVRDILLLLLQAQDNPTVFTQFKLSFRDLGFQRLENELDTIFASLKIAENFANGRWLWKRKLYPVAIGQEKEFARSISQAKKPDLEDFAYIIALTIRILEKAEIPPRLYIERLNEALSSTSGFFRAIMRCQEEQPLLVSDSLYLQLIGDEQLSSATLEQTLDDAVQSIAQEPGQTFQLEQIVNLPSHLAEIAPHCAALSKDSVLTTARTIAGVYHKNWQLFNRNVCRSIIDRLPA